MANAREIKLRIKGINETKKITKAMKLISAAKLKKARAMHDATLPFFKKVQNTMADILNHTPDIETIYFDKRDKKEKKTKGYIVIASDKGLTGGYNHNIVKMAESLVDKENAMDTIYSQLGDLTRQMSSVQDKVDGNILDAKKRKQAGDNKLNPCK